MKTHDARTTEKIYAVFRPGGAADQNISKVHREKHLSRKENFQSRLIIPVSILWTAAAWTKINIKKKFK